MKLEKCTSSFEFNEPLPDDVTFVFHPYCKSSVCLPPKLFPTHWYNVNVKYKAEYNSYQRLDGKQKLKYQRRRHKLNTLHEKCFEILKQKLKHHHTGFFIRGRIMPSLDITQKKMVVKGLLPQKYIISRKTDPTTGQWVDNYSDRYDVDFYKQKPAYKYYKMFPNKCD